MTLGIYQILNITNNKCYIGQATNLKKRMQAHSSELIRGVHSNKHLQSAWNKYGKLSFKFKILLYCSSKNLNFYEQKALNIYQVCNPQYGYNTCPIAGSCLGCVHSEETKRKHSVTSKGNTYAKGYHHTEEAKRKIAKAWKGKIRGPHSEERKRRNSEAHKGIKKGTHSEETKRKISKALRGNNNKNGFKNSEETRKKMSEAQKGRIISDEHRKKISEAHKGKILSEKTRKKMSDTRKRYWQNLMHNQ